jgi:CheY-like chemotaxis protein
MLSARRTQELRELGEAIGKVKSLAEIGRVTTDNYQDYVPDIPFLMMYEIDHKQGNARLVSNAGIAAGSVMAPVLLDLSSENAYPSWPVAAILDTGEVYEVNDLEARFGAFSCEPYDISPNSAMLLPLRLSGQQEVFGFMVAGVSACRALDIDYRNFYNLLAKSTLDKDSRSSVEATHRNALRLLKLVNNLLDYSRVEAGRAQAAYQKIDICELTTDLTSSFRSIIEKAGMELLVDCRPAKDDIFVDRQMWEKIVLNLLSNAFKYTLQGTISVNLAQEGRFVVLRVSDTGVGIPEKELPHMFERFHRVENSAGRTHEGTGIGSSLVHELVYLHDGQIEVDSTEGSGSTFTVQLPVGKHHLPPEHVLDTARETDSRALKGAFIQEVFSILEDDVKTMASGSIVKEIGDLSGHRDISKDKNTNVLIVDDNGDMRSYLKRLLEPYFTITTAVNGAEALEMIKTSKQDLVLSDVMMPVMDGKAMVPKLRSSRCVDKQTMNLKKRTIPSIWLWMLPGWGSDVLKYRDLQLASGIPKLLV